MSTRKHIIILTILITIGIGGLILGVLIPGGKIRKTQALEEHKQEYVQAPSTPSPDSLPVVSDAQEEKITTAKRSTVSASTSISVPDQYDDNGQYDDSQYDDGQSKKDEEEVVLDESMYIDENGNVTDWEKWTLARMHKHGWYKPEDVPIIYAEPEGQPDGVYISRRDVNGGVGNFQQELPEHVKVRARELKEELDRATERKEGREVIRITRELDELYRPYKSWTVLRMHLGNIPKSWHPYFDAIWEAEKEAVTQEQGY